MQPEVAEDTTKEPQDSACHRSRPTLWPSLEYPNEGAGKCAADDPGKDAIRANPQCSGDPHTNDSANGNANSHPMLILWPRFLHRVSSDYITR